MKRHIPNLLTIGNLLSGTAGIIFLFQNPQWPTAWFIWIACVFDFLDGFSARLLKVTSSIGKQLDSLADVVSFGVLPALVMFRFLENESAGWMSWLALALAAMAALRLAKFNIDIRQAEGFIGLPTPAHALFITGLPFLINHFGLEAFNLPIGLTAVVVMSVLMVSELQLPALKFKSLSLKENPLAFITIAGGLILIILLGTAGISAAILFYIFISFFSGKSLNSQKE